MIANLFAGWLGLNLGLVAALLTSRPRPVPTDDLCAVMDARETTADRAVRDLLVRAKAALRTCDYGDEDFAEWGRELMFREDA